MAEQAWAKVDAYLSGLFAAPDPVLDAVLGAAAAAGLPAHEVSPTQGKFLYLLARIQGARLILELGTLAGYSTIWLARALPPGGRLVTLEADPRHAAIARANFARAGLDGQIELHQGAALDSLAALAAAGAEPFDFVFIDADKAGNPHYLPAALALLRPGGVIVADNVIRGGMVIDGDGSDPSACGIRRFHALVAADPRLEATALQTVGSKGWDGFTLIRLAA